MESASELSPQQSTSSSAPQILLASTSQPMTYSTQHFQQVINDQKLSISLTRMRCCGILVSFGTCERFEIQKCFIFGFYHTSLQGCKSLLSIGGIIYNFPPTFPYFQHWGDKPRPGFFLGEQIK